MAKLRPRLAWMLTNRVCPSGLNVDPANSSLDRSTPVLLTRRLRAMLASFASRLRWCASRRRDLPYGRLNSFEFLPGGSVDPRDSCESILTIAE